MGLPDGVTRHAHWALRVALASVFLFHGAPKFLMASAFAQMSGIPVVAAYLTAVAETAGALLILFGGVLGRRWGGWATRLGALAFIPVMAGAIALVHWPQWSFEPSQSHPTGGMEFQVTLILISLYLLIKGNTVKDTGAPPLVSS